MTMTFGDDYADDDEADADDDTIWRLFATSQDHQLQPGGSHSIPR